MTEMQAVVGRFNDCINARDIDGLAAWMTDDHTFIDSAGGVVEGKAACLEAWRGFFDMFPDYQNVFTSFSRRDDRVIIAGYSTCSDARLAGKAIWTATIAGGQVAEWRVYADTAAVRQQLGIA